MIQLLDRIRVVRIDRAEANQLFRVAADVRRDVFVRHQHADMTRAKAEDDRAIDRLHRPPVLIEIDRDILVGRSSRGLRIGDERIAQMRGPFPYVGVYVDNHSNHQHQSTPYLL
jgi:hypothetical protein